MPLHARHSNTHAHAPSSTPTNVPARTQHISMHATRYMHVNSYTYVRVHGCSPTCMPHTLSHGKPRMHAHMSMYKRTTRAKTHFLWLHMTCNTHSHTLRFTCTDVLQHAHHTHMHTPGRACTDVSLVHATRMNAHTLRCRWTDLPLHVRQTNMHTQKCVDLDIPTGALTCATARTPHA